MTHRIDQHRFVYIIPQHARVELGGSEIDKLHVNLQRTMWLDGRPLDQQRLINASVPQNIACEMCVFTLTQSIARVAPSSTGLRLQQHGRGPLRATIGEVARHRLVSRGLAEHQRLVARTGGGTAMGAQIGWLRLETLVLLHWALA